MPNWVDKLIASRRVINQVRSDQTNDRIPESAHELHDFCQVVESPMPDHHVPLRIEVNVPGYRLYMLNPLFENDFPKDHPPVPLLTALCEDRLSAESKIHLAFTLSKSFWQYYESDWVRTPWNLENLLLLPLHNHGYTITTFNAGTHIPFLKIDSTPLDTPFLPEYEPQDPSNRANRMHRYPYILNLCLLLVLLCCEEIPLPPNYPTGVNEIYFFCSRYINSERLSWPIINITDPKKRKVYQKIVAHCLPKPYSDICLDIAERRAMLRDKVVRPLYDLLQSMQNPDPAHAPKTEVAGLQTNSRASTGVENKETRLMYAFELNLDAPANDTFQRGFTKMDQGY